MSSILTFDLTKNLESKPIKYRLCLLNKWHLKECVRRDHCSPFVAFLEGMGELAGPPILKIGSPDKGLESSTLSPSALYASSPGSGLRLPKIREYPNW